MSHCPHLKTKEPQVIGYSVCFTASSLQGGCGIHEDTRSDVCENYQCMWLQGYGEEEDRPNRSGIIADLGWRINSDAEAKQLWKGAADSPSGKKAIQRISEESGMELVLRRSHDLADPDEIPPTVALLP